MGLNEQVLSPLLMKEMALKQFETGEGSFPKVNVPLQQDVRDAAGPVFKPEWLPSPFDKLVTQQAESIEVDKSLAATALLGAVSVAVTGLTQVRVNDTYYEPVQLWFTAMLPPGERKSACMNAFMKPINGAQADENSRIAQERKPIEQNIVHLKKQIANEMRRKNCDKDKVDGWEQEVSELEEQLKPLRFLNLTTTDTTSEALVEKLDCSDGRTSIADSEGGVFGTICGRYSSGVPNLDAILQGYDSNPIHKARVGKVINIKRASISMLMFVQPSVVKQELIENSVMTERGFTGRMMLIKPQSMVGRHTFKEKSVDFGARNAYYTKISKLVNLQTIDGDVRTLDMTREAKNRYKEYALQNEERMLKRATESGEIIVGYLAKHPGRMLRIAAIVKLLDDSDTAKPITLDHIERAINIAEWAFEHMKCALNMGGEQVIDEIAHQLADTIARHDDKFGIGKEFRTSDISNYISKCGFKRKSFNERRAILSDVFDKLQEWGVVTEVSMPDAKKKRYKTNPLFIVEAKADEKVTG